ncbi:MAG: hypothetical protein ACOH1E_07945 [Brevundimonas sp.]
MEPTDTRPRRRDYKIRCKRVWILIRERYLAGESARRLAEVFDVTEMAIRQRITREGWSKRSGAEAIPVRPADVGLAAVIEGQLVGDLTPREAARLALHEAVKLLRGGQMGLAGEAARVADVMGRAAARLGDEGAVDMGPDEAAFEAVRRKVLGLDPPPLGEGDRETVEGVAGSAALLLGEAVATRDDRGASGPLHHPSDGPPPPVGEEC